MSEWTHPVCDRCYALIAPGQIPHRFREEFLERERCCECGEDTLSGIYFRANPADMSNHGEHR